MRPNGRIVAMVGGTDYAESPFNRVTQARRQPGSTFKLFVYLAALEEGMRPETPVVDAPVTIDGWSPENADGRYRDRKSTRLNSSHANISDAGFCLKKKQNTRQT